MSLITKNNYEAFLLDYVEGNLSPELTAELMLFFENHSELKEELHDFELPVLNPTSIKLNSKEALKIEKNKITVINFEDAVIAEIEGENTDKEKATLAAYLNQNPDKKKVLEAYQNTKLKAPAITYNFKEDLKQENKKVIPLYWWYSAAAAVILIIVLFNGINWNNEVKELPIAEETTLPIKEKIINNKELLIEEKVETPIIANNETPSEKKNTLKENNKKPNIITPNNTVKKSLTQVPEPIEEKEAESILAEEEGLNKNVKDTTVNEQIETQMIDHDIHYADNVRITFETDDEEPTGNPNDINNEKPTKFDVVRAAVKQQLKGFFNNTKKDAETLAAATKTIGFNRNKSEK